jgi:elongation factor P hydroxylase
MSVLQKIHRVFSETMENIYRTYLKGGGVEPVYIPPTEKEYGVIQYTQDYPRSALHELAHWCVAGSQRRQQEDYGYWYIPDGRNPTQQVAFYEVEVKPQALEFLFCEACDISFRVSVDNLEGLPGDGEKLFEQNVLQQVERYRKCGLPCRAQLLYEGFKAVSKVK